LPRSSRRTDNAVWRLWREPWPEICDVAGDVLGTAGDHTGVVGRSTEQPSNRATHGGCTGRPHTLLLGAGPLPGTCTPWPHQRRRSTEPRGPWHTRTFRPPPIHGARDDWLAAYRGLDSGAYGPLRDDAGVRNVQGTDCGWDALATRRDSAAQDGHAGRADEDDGTVLLGEGGSSRASSAGVWSAAGTPRRRDGQARPEERDVNCHTAYHRA